MGLLNGTAIECKYGDGPKLVNAYLIPAENGDVVGGAVFFGLHDAHLIWLFDAGGQPEVVANYEGHTGWANPDDDALDIMWRYLQDDATITILGEYQTGQSGPTLTKS